MKKNIFDSKAAKKLWKKSDDAVRSGRMLYELYDDVPKHLRDVSVEILEFQRFRCSKKKMKEVNKFLSK